MNYSDVVLRVPINLRVRIPAILAGGGGGGRLKKDVPGGEGGGSYGPSCFML